MSADGGFLAVFAVAAFAFALVLVWLAVVVVKQGEEWTLERFGRYSRTLEPGLHLLIPLVDRVGSRVSMRETVLDVPSQEVITRDNAMVRADGVVFFSVIDAARASYEVDGMERAIVNLTTTNIRTVMGSMDLDELLSQRDQINLQLLRVVDEATTPWGVKVSRIEIRDIVPPRDLVEAMAGQMKAERGRRAAITEAKGHRESAILKAEGEKEAAILEADGRRIAAFRAAEARERAAEAEAVATKIVSEAIAHGGSEAINYFVAQQYIESLKVLASSPNQKVILMPLETTALIGALGGIVELTSRAGASKNRSL